MLIFTFGVSAPLARRLGGTDSFARIDATTISEGAVSSRNNVLELLIEAEIPE